MDISKLSIKELQELQSRIPDEIKSRKAQEKKSIVIKEIAALAAKHGYKLEELVGQAQAGKSGQKSGTRKPAKVKFRSLTEPGLSWTGRGKKPAWVVAWLNQGKSLDDLKVD